MEDEERNEILRILGLIIFNTGMGKLIATEFNIFVWLLIEIVGNFLICILTLKKNGK